MANIYYSTQWDGLEEGTVVKVKGDTTAVIGADAFSDYSEAKAAGGDIVLCDVFSSSAWSSESAGSKVTVTIGSDQYELTVGTDAFATLSAAALQVATNQYGGVETYGDESAVEGEVVYVSGAWAELADYTVVTTAGTVWDANGAVVTTGGTAVIGVNAFATYAGANTKADAYWGESGLSADTGSSDIYLNSSWTTACTPGETVSFTLPDGTEVTATYGANAALIDDATTTTVQSSVDTLSAAAKKNNTALYFTGGTFLDRNTPDVPNKIYPSNYFYVNGAKTVIYNTYINRYVGGMSSGKGDAPETYALSGTRIDTAYAGGRTTNDVSTFYLGKDAYAGRIETAYDGTHKVMNIIVDGGTFGAVVGPGNSGVVITDEYNVTTRGIASGNIWIGNDAGNFQSLASDVNFTIEDNSSLKQINVSTRGYNSWWRTYNVKVKDVTITVSDSTVTSIVNTGASYWSFKSYDVILNHATVTTLSPSSGNYSIGSLAVTGGTATITGGTFVTALPDAASPTYGDANTETIWTDSEYRYLAITGKTTVTKNSNGTITVKNGVFYNASAEKGKQWIEGGTATFVGGTQNQFTLSVKGDQTSSIGTLADIESITIDATAQLSLGSAIATGVSITIDATDFDLGEETQKLLISTTKGINTTDITILDGGTASDQYVTAVSGDGLYLQRRPYVYSMAWSKLADGDQVVFGGATFTIGVDAFGNYATAKAKAELDKKTLTIGDKYYSAEWSDKSAGDTVYVVLDGETVSLTVGTDAFTTLTAGKTAATSAPALVLYGGSSALSGRNKWNTPPTTILFSGTYTGSANGAIITLFDGGTTIPGYDATWTVGKDSYLSSIGATGNDSKPTSVNSITYNAWDGGTIGTVYMVGYGNTLTATVNINAVDGGVIGSIYTSYTTSTMDGDVNISLSGNSRINLLQLAQQYSGTSPITDGHNVNITLDGSTITTLSHGDGSHKMSKGENSTFNVTVTGNSASTIDYWNCSTIDSLTIAVNAGLTVNYNFSLYTGTITVDAANCDYTQQEYLVLSASCDFINSYTIINEDPIKGANYEFYKAGKQLYYRKKRILYSALWADLDDGDVVVTAGRTCTIGVDAFNDYDAAVAKAAEVGNIVQDVDTYFDTTWVAGDTVTVNARGGSYTAVVSGTASGDTNAFTTQAVATSAHSGYFKNGGIVLNGNTYTKRSWLNATYASPFILTDVVSTGTLDQALLLNKGTKIGTATGGYVVIGEGSTINAACIAERSNCVQGEVITKVVDGAVVNAIYFGGLYGPDAHLGNYNETLESGFTTNATLTVKDATVKQIYGGGLSSACYAYVTVNVENSSGEFIYGGGANSGGVNYGTMTLNLTDASYTGSISYRNISVDSPLAQTNGAFTINVLGGTVSVGNMIILRNDSSDTITINAGALLITGGVYSTTAKAAYTGTITIDATDFELEGTRKLVYRQTAKMTSIDNFELVDPSGKYFLEQSEDQKELYIAMKSVVYSATWQDKAEGDTVVVDGTTFTIGYDAFSNYNDARDAATTLERAVQICDMYYSSDWKDKSAGDKVDVLLDGTTVSVTVGQNAFTSGTAASKAAGTTGAIVVYGGSAAFGGGTRDCYMTQDGQTWIFRNHTESSTVYNGGYTTKGYSGTVIVTDNSTLTKINDYDNYVPRVDKELSIIIDHAKVGEVWMSSVKSTDTYTVDATTGKIVWDGAAGHSVTNIDVTDGTINDFHAAGFGATMTGDVNVNFDHATVAGAIYDFGAVMADGAYGNLIFTLDSTSIKTLYGGTSNVGEHYIEFNFVGGTNTITEIGTKWQQVTGFAINIDAGSRANLTVGNAFDNLPAKTVITIDVDNFQFGTGEDSFTVITAASGLSKFSFNVTGTAIDDYALITTDKAVTLKKKIAYFSAAWQGLADGTVVTTPGGTATIGTDAFLLYDDAKAKADENGWLLKSADNYFSWDWQDKQAGDAVTITNASGTFSTTIGDSAIAAYNTLSSAQTASKVVGSALALVGGTAVLKGRYGWDSTPVTILSDGTILAAQGSQAGALITIFDAAATKPLYETTFSVGQESYLASIGTMGNISGATFKSVTYKAIDGGTIGTALLIGYVGTATGDIHVNVDNGGIIGSIASATSGGTYDGNVEVTLTRGGYIGSLRMQPSSNSTTTLTAGHHYNITLDGSTIGALTLDGSSSRKFVKETGASCNLTVTGSTTSYIKSWQNTYFDTVTISVGDHASLVVGGTASSMPNSITIDVDNFQFNEGESSFTVLSATKDLAGKTIQTTGTAKSLYDIVQTDTTITLTTKKSYFSVGWADLEDGTVVTTPNGTATIGDNAFATYSQAYAKYQDVIFCDTYFDTTWSELSVGDEVTVAIPGNTFTAKIDNKNFCNTLATAQSALQDYSGNAVIFTGATVTGDRTTQISLNGKKTFLYNDVSAKFGSTDLGAIVVCDTSSAGTVKTGEAIIGEGSKLAVVYGNRNGSTAKDLVFSVTVQDGAYVENLATNFNGNVGSSDTYTVDEATGKLVWAGAADHSVMTVNVEGGTVNEITPTLYSGNGYTGDIVVNVSDGLIKAITGKSVGKPNVNFYLNLAGGTIGTITPGVAANTGDRYVEIHATGDAAIGKFASGRYVITIDENAQLAIADSSIPQTNFTNNGTLKLTNDSFINVVSGTFVKIGLVGGTGNIVINDSESVSVYSATDATAKQYYTATKQDNIYVDASFAGKSVFDKISVKGGNAFFGVNAFADLKDAKDKSSATAVATVSGTGSVTGDFSGSGIVFANTADITVNGTISADSVAFNGSGKSVTFATLHDFSNADLSITVDSEDFPATGAGFVIASNVTLKQDQSVTVTTIQGGSATTQTWEIGKVYEGSNYLLRYNSEQHEFSFYEKSAASITVTMEPEGWTNADSVTVTATFVSMQSGTEEYSFDGGTTWTQYTKPLTVTEHGYVMFRATTEIGGTTYTSDNYEIKIDRIKPTITEISPSETAWTNKDVTITATYADKGGSGLKESLYKIGDGEWQKYDTQNGITVTENALVTLKATDNAGNETTTNYTVSNIDKVKPTISVTPSETKWTNQDVTITVDYADDLSGISTQEYSFNQTEWFTYKQPLVIKNNNTTIYFRATDNAGNLTTTNYTVSNIDKVKPTISVTPSTTAWTKEDVKITVDYADLGGSGLATQEYSFDQVEWFTYKQPLVIENNNTSVYFRATDNAGNVTTTNYTVTNIDKVVPTITDVKPSTTYWTNQNVTITATYADLGGSLLKDSLYKIGDGAWKNYDTENGITVTENALVTLKATDNAGNETTTTYNVTNIDKIVPTITDVKPSTTGWTNQNVTITATYADLGGSGIAAQWYKIGDGAWQNYTGLITVTENALVTFFAADNAGNQVATSYNVTNIDKIAPTITDITPSTTAWTNQDVTITATYADQGVSGLKESLYKIGDGAWQNYTGLITVTENNSTVFFKATDNAGNVTETTYLVNNIDKIVPTITDITPSTTYWTNQDVTITATYADPADQWGFTSGIAAQWYKIGDGEWQNYTGLITVTENALVTFFVADNAGNQAATSYNVTNIDKIAPTITDITPSTTAWTNQDVTITVNYADNLSGIAAQLYKIGDGEWQNYEGLITVTENALVTFYAADNAGNATVESYLVSNIDKVDPTITVTPSETEWTNQDVILRVDYTDDYSGIATQEYKKGDEEWTTYTEPLVIEENNTAVYFRATDNAGNLTITSCTVTNIDKIAPTIAEPTIAVAKNRQSAVVKTEYEDPADEWGFASGLKETIYHTGDGIWKTYDADGITVYGNATIYFRATDNTYDAVTKPYGNATEITFVVDKFSGPTIHIEATPDTWTNGTVTVSAQFYANTPGTTIISKEYSLDGFEWHTYDCDISVNNYGTIYFRGTDSAGKSASTSQTIYIDHTKPTITIAEVASGTITATFTDPGEDEKPVSGEDEKRASGIATKQYSFDQSNWFDYTNAVIVGGGTTVYFRATDHAGNFRDACFTSALSNVPQVIAHATYTTGTDQFVEKTDLTIAAGGRFILGQDSILVLDGIDPKLTLCGGTIDTNAGLATVESIDVIGTGNVISGIVSGGSLSVAYGAQLTLDFTGEYFADSFAQYAGGSIDNNGEINFSGNILFSGNATEGYAIYNTNLIRFAGSITLGTASDAWVNQGSTTVAITNWDLRNAPASDAVCINNYQYFTNVGDKTALTITVNTNQALGNYTIATGNLTDLSGKNTFFLTLDDTSYSNALVANGAAITYRGRKYQLGVYSTSLILTVSDGGRFVATSTEPVILEAGKTYTYPAYAGNGGAGEVQFGGTLTATGYVSFVCNAAMQTTEDFSGYGGAIMNIGIAQLDAATYQYNSAVNGGGFANCNIFSYTGVTSFISNAASQFGGAFYNGNYLTFGNYANFTRNYAASAGGAVCNDGQLTLSVVNFTDNFATFGGGAIYNNGSINFSGNALFSGNVSAAGGAIYNTNLIRLAGSITLETASDTWVNQGTTTVAITNWDLRNAPAANAVCINNFHYFSNVGDRTAQTITVNAYQALGNYTIATGDLTDLTGKNTFFLTLDDTSYSNALVAGGAAIAYQGRLYELGVYSTSLIMTVSAINDVWNLDSTDQDLAFAGTSFADDVLNIDTTNLTDTWTLLSGDTNCIADLESAASVSFGTSAATWNGVAWSDGTFELTTDEAKKTLLVSKLA